MPKRWLTYLGWAIETLFPRIPSGTRTSPGRSLSAPAAERSFG